MQAIARIGTGKSGPLTNLAKRMSNGPRMGRALNAFRDRLLSTPRHAVPWRGPTIATAAFLAATGLYGTSVGGHWADVGAWWNVTSAQAAQAVGVRVSAVSFEGLVELEEGDLLQVLFADGDMTKPWTTAEIRRRLASNPWVAHVEARRLLPDRLVIKIEERTPVAILQDEGLQLVTKDGVRLGRLEGDRFSALPVIAGQDALSASGELGALMRAGAWLPSSPRGAVRVGSRRWNLVLEDGSKILLPTENPQAAIAGLREKGSVDAALAGAMLTGQPIILDLRNADAIVFSAQRIEAASDEELPT